MSDAPVICDLEAVRRQRALRPVYATAEQRIAWLEARCGELERAFVTLVDLQIKLAAELPRVAAAKAAP